MNPNIEVSTDCYAAKCVRNILSRKILLFSNHQSGLHTALDVDILVQNPVIRPEKVENLSLRSLGPIWIKVVS